MKVLCQVDFCVPLLLPQSYFNHQLFYMFLYNLYVFEKLSLFLTQLSLLEFILLLLAISIISMYFSLLLSELLLVFLFLKVDNLPFELAYCRLLDEDVLQEVEKFE